MKLTLTIKYPPLKFRDSGDNRHHLTPSYGGFRSRESV